MACKKRLMEKNILLIDDDEKLRSLVTEYLEGYGFHISTFPDGNAILRNIQTTAPDIVILDIMLPGKNGLEVLKDIRRESTVPVIMLTARGEDADRIVGLELGADDYLPKPFNPRELLARVNAVIRRAPPGTQDQAAGLSMQRQLKALMSADVKDYSRLMESDELSTIQQLNRHRDLIFGHVREFRGRVVDSPGDNILAEFGSVVDAVQCATRIQGDLRAQNAGLPPERRMEFRIGINLGDVVLDRGRIYGDGVNIAARIEKLAPPGGVCISGTVYDQVENKLPLRFEYLGEKSVKNILRPVRAYQVCIEGE